MERMVEGVARLASGTAVEQHNSVGQHRRRRHFLVLLNLHDESAGSVKGMMAIADSPIYYNTVDVHPSVKDFEETTSP